MNMLIPPPLPVRDTAVTIVEMFPIQASSHRAGEIFRVWGLLTQLTTATAGSLSTLTEQIGELGQLINNWDGHGSVGVSREVRDNALSLALRLSSQYPALPEPDVYPNFNGTVSFEWESNSGEAYLEVGRTQFSGHIRLGNGWTEFFYGRAQDLGTRELELISQMLYAPQGLASPSHSLQLLETSV
jgi:hypothetical protein